MAVVTTNSTQITNNRAAPPVKNDVNHSGARKRVKSETISSVSTDSNTSQYHFFKVKAHDSIKSIKLFNDSLAASAATIDVGIYAEGLAGAAVDINCYGSAIAMNTAVTVGTEIRFESLNITTVNQAVWEDAGVSTEPDAGTEYDFVVTVLARGTTPATGDITLIVEYVAGD